MCDVFTVYPINHLIKLITRKKLNKFSNKQNKDHFTFSCSRKI